MLYRRSVNYDYRGVGWGRTLRVFVKGGALAGWDESIQSTHDTDNDKGTALSWFTSGSRRKLSTDRKPVLSIKIATTHAFFCQRCAEDDLHVPFI